MMTTNDDDRPRCPGEASLEDLLGLHVDDREIYPPSRMMMLGRVGGEGKLHCAIGPIPLWRRLLRWLQGIK
jgi:hypothetical protein